MCSEDPIRDLLERRMPGERKTFQPEGRVQANVSGCEGPQHG